MISEYDKEPQGFNDTIYQITNEENGGEQKWHTNLETMPMI